jgi:hypothetical protein
MRSYQPVQLSYELSLNGWAKRTPSPGKLDVERAIDEWTESKCKLISVLIRGDGWIVEGECVFRIIK